MALLQDLGLVDDLDRKPSLRVLLHSGLDLAEAALADDALEIKAGNVDSLATI